MNRHYCVALIAAMLLLFVSSPTLHADVSVSVFSALSSGSTDTVSSDPDGTNTGWSSTGEYGEFGEFIEYPVPGSASSWWSQWFYNDPQSPERWKWIDCSINFGDVIVGSFSDNIEVGISWSTMAYPKNSPSPPDDSESEFIERHTIYTGLIPDSPISVSPLFIPDYNPEWLSIDIRVIRPSFGYASNFFSMAGQINHHTSVPEPSVLVLLMIGVLALLFTRRR